ncbi:hypothetical protein [Streptomyces sp. Tu 2975]|uniref:hypothetical protein n=1 Tax=Streptomyces sp. Tu 2975 TaxID=2676871 RepID=UPI001FC9DA97|nr:hypothetical protein [Streptomyces sp. Tu 2975]
MGMSWAVAGFVAPILAGWVVDGPGPDVLWMGCAVVGAVAAVGYSLLLRRALAETGGPVEPSVTKVVEVAKATDVTDMTDMTDVHDKETEQGAAPVGG